MLEYMFHIKWKNMNVKVINLISKINETRFLVQHKLMNCVSVNVDWITKYVIQSKNGIMIYVGVSVKIKWMESLWRRSYVKS